MSEAVSKSPSSAAQTMARVRSGSTLETTEMTPRAPSAMAGTARSSLPHQTKKSRGHSRRIPAIFRMSGEASLTPITLGRAESAL